MNEGDIMAIDRAYIDYQKLDGMLLRRVVYVTKMKKNLKYSISSDTMYQTPDGLMEVRIQKVHFTKQCNNGQSLTHKARIITYVDLKK